MDTERNNLMHEGFTPILPDDQDSALRLIDCEHFHRLDTLATLERAKATTPCELLVNFDKKLIAICPLHVE